MAKKKKIKNKPVEMQEEVQENKIRQPVFIALVLIFLIPFLLLNFSIKEQKDKKAFPIPELIGKEMNIYQQGLDYIKPDIMFLGNSMVGNIDKNIVEKNFPDRKFIFFQRGGTFSPWSYLNIKNVILPHAHRPDTIIILFRDNFWTKPEHLSKKPTQASNISTLCTKNEPHLQKIVWPEAKRELIEQIPVGRKRKIWLENQNKRMKRLFGFISGNTEETLQTALDSSFHDDRKNAALLTKKVFESETKYTAEEIIFNKNVEKSLLPATVAMCQKENVQLVFLRIPSLRNKKAGAEDPPEIKQYIKDMSAWLAERNIPLIDLGGKTYLTQEDYGHGDHLTKNAAKEYTRKLVLPELKKLFR